MTTDREKFLLLSPKETLANLSCRGNDMAHPNQMVVGKDILNSLIAEDLLKILKKPKESSLQIYI